MERGTQASTFRVVHIFDQSGDGHFGVDSTLLPAAPAFTHAAKVAVSTFAKVAGSTLVEPVALRSSPAGPQPGGRPLLNHSALLNHSVQETFASGRVPEPASPTVEPKPQTLNPEL